MLPQGLVITPIFNASVKNAAKVDITGKYIERLIPGYVEKAVQELNLKQQGSNLETVLIEAPSLADARIKPARVSCFRFAATASDHGACTTHGRRRRRPCHSIVCPFIRAVNVGAAVFGVTLAVWLVRDVFGSGDSKGSR